jgi:acid phosphatase family membrane protein YuiD
MHNCGSHVPLFGISFIASFVVFDDVKIVKRLSIKQSRDRKQKE